MEVKEARYLHDCKPIKCCRHGQVAFTKAIYLNMNHQFIFGPLVEDWRVHYLLTQRQRCVISIPSQSSRRTPESIGAFSNGNGTVPGSRSSCWLGPKFDSGLTLGIHVHLAHSHIHHLSLRMRCKREATETGTSDPTGFEAQEMGSLPCPSAARSPAVLEADPARSIICLPESP